ncbi:tRNA pseudouridine synthase Pus10-like isoform X4 [Anticarsia gemmatalis]|uniref:tRNA pseudouridine synthase Pus10-like isoform X4 n=1 Tax=Anticarsia gemmatalis TaxID=129554 RepID=UPI003F7773C9
MMCVSAVSECCRRRPGPRASTWCRRCYKPNESVMPLKEAWKWSFGRRLAARVDKQLDSGAVAPLLVTLTVEYPDDLQELEVLKSLAPALFESRSKQRRRFAVEFTRRVVEQALGRVTLAALRGLAPPAPRPPRAAAPARPVAAQAQRAPLYLAGRYLKLSRDLPQTPWLVAGRRMMDSSVQEIIFEPVAAAYGVPPDEAERCLKFMSAGREDVDVRCLGTGRPFALEISDPRRRPDDAELQRVCELIGLGGRVRVPRLLHIEREDLALLKKGEESKCKTYEALCIKLSHTDLDLATTNGAGDAAARRAPEVTERDIANINAYSNTAPGDPARVLLSQRTPVRVLHRRPLLTRARRIYALSARAVPGKCRELGGLCGRSDVTVACRRSAGAVRGAPAHGGGHVRQGVGARRAAPHAARAGRRAGGERRHPGAGRGRRGPAVAARRAPLARRRRRCQ